MTDFDSSCSKLGVFCDYSKMLAICRNGEVLGIHVTTEGKSQVVRLDLETQKTFFYDFKHQKCAMCILLCQKNDLVLSGGIDQVIACQHYSTGNTLKVVQLGIGSIFCFFRFQNVICVGAENTVRFLDLISLEEIITQDTLQTQCQKVTCMYFSSKKSSGKTYDSHLLIGGTKNPNITKALLPKILFSQETKFNVTSKAPQMHTLIQQNTQFQNKIQNLQKKLQSQKAQISNLKTQIKDQRQNFQEQLQKQSQLANKKIREFEQNYKSKSSCFGRKSKKFQDSKQIQQYLIQIQTLEAQNQELKAQNLKLKSELNRKNALQLDSNVLKNNNTLTDQMTTETRQDILCNDFKKETLHQQTNRFQICLPWYSFYKLLII